MDFEDLDIVQLANLSLSQKKYQDGELIISGIKDGNDIIAIDVRFYIMKEKDWMPTKTGFWLAKEHWNSLRKVLLKDVETIEEEVCWESKWRKFVVRYFPTYGGGVDFRYYCETKKYTGWEKKGIRIARKDYAEVNKAILKSIRNSQENSGEKDIVVTKTDRDKGRSCKKGSINIEKASINPALIAILSD